MLLEESPKWKQQFDLNRFPAVVVRTRVVVSRVPVMFVTSSPPWSVTVVVQVRFGVMRVGNFFFPAHLL